MLKRSIVMGASTQAASNRTVDAHIKNIRGKLKKINPDIDPIRTHRAMGYSLKEIL